MKGSILTDPTLIEAELLRYHYRSWEENSSVPPGTFTPVTWEKPFNEKDEVLEITDDLVVRCIAGLKNSSSPDNMKPAIIKLLFGAKDLVKPLGEMIRAVARTRTFAEGGENCTTDILL